MSTEIIHFKGEYRFLSNFFGCDVRMDGLVYPSAEHAFQAHKTLRRLDRIGFTQGIGPALAKQMGRELKLRPRWEKIKLDIMREVVLHKFAFNQELAGRLADTDNMELWEGNNWGDTFWGVDDQTYLGENWLGKILMETRAILV